MHIEENGINYDKYLLARVNEFDSIAATATATTMLLIVVNIFLPSHTHNIATGFICKRNMRKTLHHSMVDLAECFYG